ncbi:hypothetical protein G8764_09890 [Pseudomaricurvus alcaniphilus]|uniref:hypothetical protein n=1 Tax=Pseudomaricurvus alcaniphilus TaxID=1166482 RepID=UPI00140C32A7|nr:hypothetical protein [Pseudomaricurvus alcaniphilus]NHN37603.1 hypothetical protein [Pseudomaricurvus alcaniphilus]
MKSKALVVGHSHVNCIQKAVNLSSSKDFEVLNIRQLQKAKVLNKSSDGLVDRTLLRNPSPDVICISLSGNEHNILGLVEDPNPFSVGDFDLGSVPHDSSRWLIPRNIMLEVFTDKLTIFFNQAKSLCNSFPDAKKMYLNPPPPISDWMHITRHPKFFKEVIGRGPAPDDLKLELYKIQTDVLKSFASDLGAHFVDAPPAAIDDRGFLRSEFYNDDPTHGNIEYGKLVVKLIEEILEKSDASL